MSIKVVACHEMYKHLDDIRAFLMQMSEEWYGEAVNMYNEGMANFGEKYLHQKDPLPFKVKFDPNLMGHDCSFTLTDFLVNEHHWSVERLMMFIKKQANK